MNGVGTVAGVTGEDDDHMATKKIEHSAARGEVLTLDEIASWVQDAMRAGASGDQPVEARVSWGQKLIRLAIEVPDQLAPVDSDV